MTTKSDSLDQLAAALVAAQGEMPAIPRTAANPFFKSKYADLASIVEKAGPIIAKHGLAVSQFVGADDRGGSTLTTILLHSSGEYIADAMPLLLAKQDPQSQGSAITYARRYAYSAVLGLVTDDDDDGNATRVKRDDRDTATKVNPKMTEVQTLYSKLGVKGNARIELAAGLLGIEPFGSHKDLSPTQLSRLATLLRNRLPDDGASATVEDEPPGSVLSPGPGASIVDAEVVGGAADPSESLPEEPSPGVHPDPYTEAQVAEATKNVGKTVSQLEAETAELLGEPAPLFPNHVASALAAHSALRPAAKVAMRDWCKAHDMPVLPANLNQDQAEKFLARIGEGF